MADCSDKLRLRARSRETVTHRAMYQVGTKSPSPEPLTATSVASVVSNPRQLFR
jgi:hypothetical protein